MTFNYFWHCSLKSFWLLFNLLNREPLCKGPQMWCWSFQNNDSETRKSAAFLGWHPSSSAWDDICYQVDGDLLVSAYDSHALSALSLHDYAFPDKELVRKWIIPSAVYRTTLNKNNETLFESPNSCHILPHIRFYGKLSINNSFGRSPFHWEARSLLWTVLIISYNSC